MENLNQETILDFLRQHRQEMAERFGVRKIALFGSFAENRQTADSDIDLPVEMDEADYNKLSALHDFLEDSFQYPVDILRTSRNIETSFRKRIGKQALHSFVPIEQVK